MSISREQLARLTRDASSMGTANHGRYVSEAMLAMRDPAFAGDAEREERDAPVRALKLLDVMWGGAFARRPDQRAALNDVGTWLETRLARAPQATVMELLTELGWLKRLAKHYEALREDAGRPTFGPPGRGDQRSFGKRIGEIERRRGEAPPAAPKPAPEAAKPRAEEPLLATLEVEFEDFNRAREARKLAADREKKKKDPKEALLSLVARGGAAAGVKLVCSTTQTEGMAEVMDRVRHTAGAPDWWMVASGMVKGADGVVFVGKINLQDR